MKPSHDPNSAQFPDRVFYAGQWRTDAQLARYREEMRRYDAERNASYERHRTRVIRDARKNLRRSKQRAEELYA